MAHPDQAVFRVTRTCKPGQNAAGRECLQAPGRQRSARRHPRASVKVTRRAAAHRERRRGAAPDVPAHSGVSRPGRRACRLPPNAPLDFLHPRKPPNRAGKAEPRPSLMGHQRPPPPQVAGLTDKVAPLCPAGIATSPQAQDPPVTREGIHRKGASPHPALAGDTAVRITCLDSLWVTQKNPEIPLDLPSFLTSHTFTCRLRSVRSLELCAGLPHEAGCAPARGAGSAIRKERRLPASRPLSRRGAGTSRLWALGFLQKNRGVVARPSLDLPLRSHWLLTLPRLDQATPPTS